MVTRPHAGSKAIDNTVCIANCLCFIGEFLDGDNWPKDFVLNSVIVLVEMRDDGWLEVITGAINNVTARLDLGMIWKSIDKALNMSELIGVIY